MLVLSRFCANPHSSTPFLVIGRLDLGTSSNVPKTLSPVPVHQRVHRDSNLLRPPRPTYGLLCSLTHPMAGHVSNRYSSEQTYVHTESRLVCEWFRRIRCMHDCQLRSTITPTWFTQRSKCVFRSSYNSIHKSFIQGIMVAHTSIGMRRSA